MSGNILPAGLNLDAVAYALARVLAAKSISEDPKLSRLDALGRSAAVHSMAQVMAPLLSLEAAAAAGAVLAQLQFFTLADAGRPVPPHGSGPTALNDAYSERRRHYALANPGRDLKGTGE
jgi:hypothetical protein